MPELKSQGLDKKISYKPIAVFFVVGNRDAYDIGIGKQRLLTQENYIIWPIELCKGLLLSFLLLNCEVVAAILKSLSK